MPIKNINDLVEFLKNNCDLESIYLEGIDYNIFSGKLNSDAVDLDFNNSLLQIFTYSKGNFKWEVDSLDLNQYCKSTHKKADEEKNKKFPNSTLPADSRLMNREYSSNITNSNINQEDVSYEISNVDENIFISNVNWSNNISNNNKNTIEIGNSKKGEKHNFSNISKNLFELTKEKIIFDSKPIIEKSPHLSTNEADKLSVSKLDFSNNANEASKKEKMKKLDTLNDFKFKEKVYKLKLNNSKADLNSKKIDIGKTTSLKKKADEINKIISNHLSLNITSNTTIHNIEIVAKEQNKLIASKKLSEASKKISIAANLTDKIVDKLVNIVKQQILDEKPREIIIEKVMLSEKGDLSKNNSTLLNLVSIKNKSKDEDKKNMLHHLINLHRFGI